MKAVKKPAALARATCGPPSSKGLRREGVDDGGQRRSGGEGQRQGELLWRGSGEDEAAEDEGKCQQ